MNLVTQIPAMHDQQKLVQLARELAMGIRDVDDILKSLDITYPTFEKLKTNAMFTKILESEVITWNSALNTNARVQVKASAMLEEWLPHIYGEMVNTGVDLNKRVEAGKLVAKLAGMDNSGSAKAAGDIGQKFSVTINLGADQQIKIEKSIEPAPVTIEHE